MNLSSIATHTPVEYENYNNLFTVPTMPILTAWLVSFIMPFVELVGDATAVNIRGVGAPAERLQVQVHVRGLGAWPHPRRD